MEDNDVKLLRAVLQPYPEGILVSQLKNEFRGTVGHDVSYSRHGFKTLEAYLRSLDEVCEVYQLESGQSVVRSISTAKTHHLDRMIQAQNRSDSGFNQATSNALKQDRRSAKAEISTPLKTNLINLVKRSDSGIDVTNLNTRYRIIYGTGIDWKRYGCSDINDFIQNRLLPTGCFRVTEGKVTLAEGLECSALLDKERKYKQFVVGEEFYKLLLATQFKQSLEQSVLPKLKVGETYCVAWTYINSHQDFGLNLLSEVKPLFDLRETMQSYYQNNYSTEELQYEHVDVESLVVVQENGFWCRGKVAKKQSYKFLVTLLDSGHKSWCRKVYGIQPPFLNLPVQGIRARLDCKDIELTEQIRKKFKMDVREAFKQTGLVMRLLSVQTERATVQLMRKSDTGPGVQISINEIL